jgi:hypothetical protein
MKPEFSIFLDASFRANRTYFHSTDLYDSLISTLRINCIEPTEFDLKIHAQITSQPQINFFRVTPRHLENHPAAIAKFMTPGGAYTAFVVNGGSKIQKIKPYDETSIWSKITVKNGCFEVNDCPSYSPIEVVTSVGVFAHKSLFPPPSGRRWLLTQISANRLLGETETQYFKLEVARKLGTTLVQTNMIDQFGVFGKMLFILK